MRWRRRKGRVSTETPLSAFFTLCLGDLETLSGWWLCKATVRRRLPAASACPLRRSRETLGAVTVIRK